jgi:predicted enzyme related to lactoylglutathione lyase
MNRSGGLVAATAGKVVPGTLTEWPRRCITSSSMRTICRPWPRFWAQVLDWSILSEREREVVIGADEAASVWVCFMPVTEVKTVKNRLQLDLNPGPDDRDAEIERILALGARRVNIGQTGAESWTVLADPEGNEFCVLRPKKSLIY